MVHSNQKSNWEDSSPRVRGRRSKLKSREKLSCCPFETQNQMSLTENSEF